MARSLSSTAISLMNAQDCADPWLWIIQISHSSLATPLRFTENTEAITFSGDVYSPFPFTLILPDDLEDGVPDGSITIDNIDGSIFSAIAGITDGATCSVGLVLASAPSVNLLGDEPGALVPFKMKSWKFDEFTITASLSLDLPYDEPFPGDYFTPVHFPYLFISLDESDE